MTTYYRDGEVLITSAGVRMNGRALRHDQLLEVWHRQGRRSWSTILGRSMIALAVILPIVVGALAVGVAVVIHASPALTVGLVGGGILVGLAAAPLADVVLDHLDRSYDRGSRPREIWARTRSGSVLLLSTRDAARFGRIYRALQRALEPVRH
jgi:hypothetical protein